MMTAESSTVAHGLRCSPGASNSTGIPRNAAICFHDSSGAALSRSGPSACLDKRSTSAIASISRAFCGSSGATGSGNYRTISSRIAALGYDVVLFDSNAIIKGRQGRSLSEATAAAIEQARKMPHALPGKVALVGFSQGGGMALGYGPTALTDQVAVVAAWYPQTSEFKDVPGWAARVRAPVVMFAGTADEYKFCCMIAKAQEIASAAKAANAAEKKAAE